MPVVDVVVRVVVVVEEVPAGDVVDIAVAVPVGAVAEGDGDVLGREHAGGAGPARVAQVDAAVAGVVLEVEDPVAVGVVGVLVARAVDARNQRRTAVVGHRELALIEPDLVAQVVDQPRVVPLHAGIEFGDGHVGPAGGHGPGRVRGGARVEDARPAHAIELPGLVVDRLVPRLGSGRVLPVVTAEVVGRRTPGGQAEGLEVVRVEPRAPAVGEVRLRRRGRQRPACGERQRHPDENPPHPAPRAAG